MPPQTHWRKYPRTLHHPASPGTASDDKITDDVSWLEGTEIVVTEKMDGENTTLYSDGFHARSLDSVFHPSRSWLAGFHGAIAHLIPPDLRICGENMYAKHAIAYDALDSFFLAFSVWKGDICLSWDDTIDVLSELGIATVPVLFRGTGNAEFVSKMIADLNTGTQEGIVIRRADSFQADAFSNSVIKWVRAGHVQIETHWRNSEIVPNKMKDGHP